MKRAKRLFVKGSVHGMFFENFVKENAGKLRVKGFLRKLEDGRIEIFFEGDGEKVDEFSEICKRGGSHSLIKKADEKNEKFQGFKDFKILRI